MRPEPFCVFGADTMSADCAKCGREHTAGCTAHKSRRDPDGNLIPCGLRPMRGQTVCQNHGGKAGRAMANAARRLAQKEALDSIADVAVTPIGDPLDALAQVASEAVALKDHFANLVAELNKTMAFENRLGEQKLDARVALYERALDRSHRFLVDWVRLGFDERKAQLDDARANLIRTVIVGVLNDLGHQLDTEPVRDSLARWLPVLDGRPPPSIDGGGTP